MSGEPVWWPQEDEIDLVDLGVSLWQRRWLILVVFAIVLVLGVVAALLHGRSYEYSAVVHIGSYTTPNGNVVPIEDATSSTATMKSAYLPGAIQDYIHKHPSVDPRQIKISVESPKNSSVVQLKAKGPESLGSALMAIERQAAQSLVKYDGRKTDVIRAKLKRQLGNAQLELQRLQDPAYFQVKKLAKEEALAGAQANVAKLQGEAQVLKAQLSNEQSLRKILSTRARSLVDYMASARKQMQSGGEVTHSAQSAMSMLLLGTEMQRNANMLQQVEQKLTTTIPNTLAQIHQQVAQNSRQQAIAQKQVAQAQQDLKQFAAQHERRIKAQNLEIAELQTQMNNLSNTALVSKPNRSSLPVGMGRKTILLLSVVLGLVLALFAALASAYASAVRDRVRAESEPDGA